MTPKPLHSDPLYIPQGEHGVVRVFAAQLTHDERQLLQQDPARLHSLLGNPDLTPAQIDMVQIADLGDLGLGGYLAEGHDVPETALNLGALAEVKGTVLIVPSAALSAFGGTIHPAEGVSLVGTYLSADADPARLWPAAAADQADAIRPASAPNPGAPTRRAPAGPVVTLAVVLLALAVWWWL